MTAIEVEPRGCWHVLGVSVVMIYDARQARLATGPLLGASDLRLSVLPAGSRYAPSTGAAILRGGNASNPECG